MWDDYQSEQDHIKAPEFLKTKTLQQMKEARQKKRQLLTQKPLLGLASGLFVLLVITFGLLNRASDSPVMVTEINFQRLDGGPRHFGNLESRNQPTILAEIESSLDVFFSTLILEAYQLNDVSWLQETDHLRIRYHFEHAGASIRILVDNQAETLQTNSILNNIPIGLYYWVMLDTTFIAEFSHAGIYFQIEASGMNEDDFLSNVQEILNFFHES